MFIALDSTHAMCYRIYKNYARICFHISTVVIFLHTKSALLTLRKIPQKWPRQRRKIYIQFKYLHLWPDKCCLIFFLMGKFVFRCSTFSCSCISVWSFDLIYRTILLQSRIKNKEFHEGKHLGEKLGEHCD